MIAKKVLLLIISCGVFCTQVHSMDDTAPAPAPAPAAMRGAKEAEVYRKIDNLEAGRKKLVEELKEKAPSLVDALDAAWARVSQGISTVKKMKEDTDAMAATNPESKEALMRVFTSEAFKTLSRVNGEGILARYRNLGDLSGKKAVAPTPDRKPADEEEEEEETPKKPKKPAKPAEEKKEKPVKLKGSPQEIIKKARSAVEDLWKRLKVIQQYSDKRESKLAGKLKALRRTFSGYWTLLKDKKIKVPTDYLKKQLKLLREVDREIREREKKLDIKTKPGEKKYLLEDDDEDDEEDDDDDDEDDESDDDDDDDDVD